MENITYDRIKELFIKHGYLPNDDLIWRAYIGIMQTVGKRKEGQDVYASDESFEFGKGKMVRDGNDVAIIATGLMVKEAVKASDILKQKGHHARVLCVAERV